MSMLYVAPCQMTTCRMDPCFTFTLVWKTNIFVLLIHQTVATLVRLCHPITRIYSSPVFAETTGGGPVESIIVGNESKEQFLGKYSEFAETYLYGGYLRLRISLYRVSLACIFWSLDVYDNVILGIVYSGRSKIKISMAYIVRLLLTEEDSFHIESFSLHSVD